MPCAWNLLKNIYLNKTLTLLFIFRNLNSLQEGDKVREDSEVLNSMQWHCSYSVLNSYHTNHFSIVCCDRFWPFWVQIVHGVTKSWPYLWRQMHLNEATKLLTKTLYTFCVCLYTTWTIKNASVLKRILSKKCWLKFLQSAVNMVWTWRSPLAGWLQWPKCGSFLDLLHSLYVAPFPTQPLYYHLLCQEHW